MFGLAIKWLEQHLIPCFYKKFFGVECPGCGMQRSIIALFKGDFQDSFLLYPPLGLLVTLLALLIIHILFDLKYGAQMLKWLFIVNVIIIVLNFIYNITQTNEICCAT